MKPLDIIQTAFKMRQQTNTLKELEQYPGCFNLGNIYPANEAKIKELGYEKVDLQ